METVWNRNMKYNEDIDGTKRNEIITWNNDIDTIFCINKKKTNNKKFKRMGIHMVIKNPNEKNNSPELINCKGYSKNIRPKNRDNMGFIYIENEVSRKLNT